MKKFSILTLAALFIAFAAPAFADKEDIDALNAAKISLTEAIAIAEKDTGGKAIEASIDGGGPVATYEVNVVKDGKIWEVYVNPADGKVASKHEDIDD